MIRFLRKRHLYMWSVLAVLLPIGFVAALLVQKAPKEVGALSFKEEGKLLGQMYLQWGPVQRRMLADSTQELQFRIVEAVKAAGLVVYIAESEMNEPADGQLLARLDTRDAYDIRLDKSWAGKEIYLLFYDPVKQEVIGKSYW